VTGPVAELTGPVARTDLAALAATADELALLAALATRWVAVNREPLGWVPGQG
jgi:predicted short-subunit dehydrogenase-like oxidoreductase (DUF2520 family)